MRGEAEGNVVAISDKQIARQVARGLLAAEGRERDGTDPAELAALIDRLANRLGSGALCRLMPQESHIPERAMRPVPALAPLTGAGWDPERQRPVRLLPRPEPIEAMAQVPDDPPFFFRWRRLEHRVRRADGPERICGEWWRDAAAAEALRDYYRVEDEAGRRFWLYPLGALPARRGALVPARVLRMTAYAELQVTTNFSFLRGASHPAELVLQAQTLGHGAIAIADRNTLAGVVRAHAAAKELGFPPRHRLPPRLTDAPSLLCYPDRPRRLWPALPPADARQAPRREGRVRSRLWRCRRACRRAGGDRAAAGAAGGGLCRFLKRIAADFGDRAYVAGQHLYRGDDAQRLHRLAASRGARRRAARRHQRRALSQAPSGVAAGRRHLHPPGLHHRRGRLPPSANAERHLKSADEMERLFRDHPDAVARTLEIVERCRFTLDELRYQYPDETGAEACRRRRSSSA